MSSADPLSDPLSTHSDTSAVPAADSPTEAWQSKESDLFAAPFQSAAWNERQISKSIEDMRHDEDLGGEAQASIATGQPEAKVVTRSLSTNLNAQAPTFVPSFANVPSASSISSSTPPTLPLDIPPSPSPPESKDLEEDAVEDATPRTKPSPLSLAASNSSNSLNDNLPVAKTNAVQSVAAEAENGANSKPLSVSTTLPLPPSSSSSTTYSPSILRNLIAQSCQTGDLARLKHLLSQSQETSCDLFTLSNSINSATGFAPLHHAAKKGHLEIVEWLIREAGAISGLEDSDGETALHKACLSGRVEVAEYLVGIDGVDIEASDNDGWTPLHNAASAGSLPLISLLLAHGAALSPPSSHGYTPLMNAASKGHLPTVHLLLKRGADPLIRNEWGETAFDLAAGVFEVRCCEVLNSYEKINWRAKIEKAKREGKRSVEDYSLLGLHSTVPVVLYENQRLVTASLAKIPTLSKLLDSGNQKWTSKALSRNDRRAAFTLPGYVLEGMADEGGESEGEERACFRSEVGLPVVGNENCLVVPEKREIRSGGRVKVPALKDGTRSQTLKKKRNQPSLASNSLSTILASTSSSPPLVAPSISTTVSSQNTAWIWLSSWTIDLSSPLSSPIDGWSYSQSFDTPLEEWQPSLPVEGTGNAKKWVRRRRWVRVMRRRVDIKNWGYLDSTAHEEGDYRAKAQFIIGKERQDEEEDDVKSSTSPTKQGKRRQSFMALERAAQELRCGIEVDEDQERRREAQADLEKILEQIALRKVYSDSREDGEGEDGDSDEEFVYDGQDAEDGEDARSIWTTTRPSSLRTPSVSHGQESTSSDYFSSTPTNSRHPDLTPQLAQNPEFRVPTDEHASFFPTMSRSSSGQYSQHHRTAWEPDEAANECRRCGTGFTFFKRKHHCRRCGLVCCNSCTTHKDPIDPYLVVREPGIPPTLEDLQPWALSSPLLYRTCDSCHAALGLPQGLSSSANQPSSILSPQSFFPASPSMGSLTPSETNESEVSELSDCPCCGAELKAFGNREKQEDHVRTCLEEGEGSISSGRYLVFNLPPGPLVGEDCGICFTEFEVNDRMARLVCLCTFHETCIRAWLSRGHTCPVHVPRED